MKNIKKYIILFLVFTTSTLLFNNCKKEIDTNFQKNSSLSEDKNADFLTEGETIIIDKPYTFSDLFIFPVGTELSIIDNKLVYKLPEGFALLAKVLMPDGTIQIKQQTGGNCIFTCDVNTEGQSGGCSPIVNSKNGDCGCEMTGVCETCTKSGSSSSVSSSLKSSEVYEFIDAQIVNFNFGVHLIPRTANIDELKNPKPFIFENREVRQLMDDFLSGYNNPKDGIAQKGMSYENVAENYSMVPVNFLGTILIIGIDPLFYASIRLFGDDHLYPPLKASFSCQCLSGNKGCNKGSIGLRLATIFYCNAESCNSCALHY